MVDSLCFTVCNYNYRAKVQKKMHTRKKKCFFLLVNEEEPLLSSVKNGTILGGYVKDYIESGILRYTKKCSDILRKSH